jgi:signal transduction histidine kinase
MIAPTVGVAAILLLLGGFAAWYVHSLQQESAATQMTNVAKVTAAEELVVISHDLRNTLTDYLTQENRRDLAAVQDLEEDARIRMRECEELADSDEEYELVRNIKTGYQRFHTSLLAIGNAKTPDDQRNAVAQLTTEAVTQKILAPVKDYLALVNARMQEGARRDQLLADRMGIGLFVLGACGAVAGLVAGFGFARSVHRSIVQFSVPVHDAAGKLSEVIGPIDVAAETLGDLESTMQTVADRVSSVVERLQESQAVARRSEQLASLGQLAAGIAHELRNPLTSMKVIVQTAAEQPDDPKLDARDLAVLTEEITRLENRIQSFLDFARPPQPVKCPCIVREVLIQTIEFVSFRAKQIGIQIEYEVPDNIVKIQADAGQLREVMLNLLLNAIDASPENATVHVRLTHHEGYVEQSGRPLPVEKSDHVRIDVEDEGDGLAEEIVERIFEPFASTKESGTGLGLSICKRIVEDHGGRITAASLPSGGAVFSVVLPVGQQEAQTCPHS